ncbi:SusC/RagA family TonB-linked outer membrane protein [Hymenobacter fodinae]|uniref:SusC/RagA family TonB-linked outer membrane protein n=1 Tax=Hymenobacter fodinae TaxID=2510796 RepID=A0A4Z0PD07_9BACT|nr:SusC/RagA family TonB-linked outer membrane protein [Hymenobacter fodinae]TGE10535.1 SusC/RagA family TonB-linked outer membrane protein [Hymenobacter fodinae]
MKKLLWSPLALGVLLASPPSYAQTAATRTITGVVTGANDQQPLPGVNVLVKGTTLGTQTDGEGRYSLPNVPEGSTLVFSFIGYTSQEYRLGNSPSANISLAPDSKSLNEVVVTGYGIKQERTDLNYSAPQVQGSELVETRQTNIVNALQGKVAGVQITSSGGAPGEGAAIVIRGGNSLDGNNQPLFVVDGIIMDNNSFVESTAPGGGSGFNGLLGRSTANQNRAGDLNPEDIQSMTVLKGPAAAAIYGLRAANGAVIITTKKGAAGRATITYRTQFSVDEVNRLPKLQDQYKQGANGVFDATTRNSFGPRFQPGEQAYDNLGDFFQTGKSWQHYLTMSGGTDRSTFLFSGSRTDVSGVAPTSLYDKTTLRLSGTSKLTEKLSVTGSAQYLNVGGRTPLQGPGLFASTGGYLVSLLSWPRNDDARNYLNPDGTRRRLLGTGTSANDADNPYFTVYRNPQTTRTNRFIGNVQTTLDLYKWLGLSYNIGTDFYVQKDRSIRAVGTSQASNQDGGVGETATLNRLLTSNFLVTLKHELNENVNGSLVLGNTVEMSRAEVTDNLGLIFLNPFPAIPSINNTVNRNTLITNTERRLIGNFARLNVNLFQQVNVELNGRIDQSSTLPRPGENKNFGRTFGYGSVALGWQFTKLFGLDQNPWLNYGKIRGSVAEVGKDTGPYRVDSPLAQATYIGGGFRNGFYGSNRLLVPERTRAYEVGIDLQFLRNRLGLEANIYQQDTRDQLIAPRVSQATGFILQYINGGTVTNKGIEVALRGTPVQSSTGFNWDINANFYANRNKATKLPGFLTEVYQSDAFIIDVARGGAFPGKPISSISSLDFQRAPDGQILINATTGYPLINTSTFVYAGNRAPDYTVQVTNNFRYKDLSLAFLLDFRKGGKVVNGNDWFATRQGLSERTLDRYKQVVFSGVVAQADGSYVPNTRPVEVTQAYYQNILGAIGTPFIEDGSWSRLRYVTLTYNLPTTLFSNSKTVQGVELAVTGRNLVLLTKYSGVDPETSAAGAGVRGGGSSGFDYGSVPGTRGVDMSVRVKF